MPPTMHFAAEFGQSEHGNCAACGGPLISVLASSWGVGEQETPHPDVPNGDFVEPEGEVSGNYCPACNTLAAVYVNVTTTAQRK